ncbi:MAG: helix-turn-helix transcriptional regulator [Bacteroidota bacterium]
MEDERLYSMVGTRIKTIREQKGLSQQDLSLICNIEKTNLSRIEAGRTNLTIKNLYKISKALKIRMKEIIDVDEEDEKDFY